MLFLDEPASALEGIGWVRSVTRRERNGYSVFRLDGLELETAKRALPGLVFKSGLTPIRYELTGTSLEEIFIDLVGTPEDGE